MANPISNLNILKFQSDFFSFLYADHGPFYKENVKKLEDATGLKREMLAYGLIGLNCVYMIIGSGAEFVCNLIGVAYPAYVSVKVQTVQNSITEIYVVYLDISSKYVLIRNYYYLFAHNISHDRASLQVVPYI